MDPRPRREATDSATEDIFARPNGNRVMDKNVYVYCGERGNIGSEKG